MRFSLLGQVEVTTSEGRSVPLPPIRRRVLCALLVAGESGLSAEALTEAVWGDDDVYAHEGPLKSIVSQLRRVLPERIPLGASGRYRMVLHPSDRVDVDEFRDLVAEAAPLVDAGEYAAAAKLLTHATSLWGDPPLPDLPDDYRLLRDARNDLLDERRAALCTLWRARMHLGEHRDVVREVRSELAVDHLDEELHWLLMTGLYRSGHRVEALRHYTAMAAQFEQETGIQPGARLRRLRDEIAADGDTQPEPSALRVVPAQLPPDVVHFTGRTQEIDDLAELLRRNSRTAVPIIAISGPGGVGKTALATHVAHRVRDDYPDGQLYVYLSGMQRPRDVGEVLGEVLISLGVRAQDLPRTPAERTGLFRSLLAGRRVLLLLDDVAGVHQVHPLVPGAAGCAVIVTSRAFLPDPSMRNVRLYPLPACEALTMLGEIIGRERVAAEPDAADAVVQACNGFPLAVRIAAARLTSQPNWTLSYFAPKLGDRLKGLNAGDVAISASIGESYDALPDDLRKVFRVLALAGPGDFPAWVVAMLLESDDAEDILEALVMRSLVLAAGVDSLGQPRYRLHDLLRDYAAARLAEHVDERDLAMERLLLGWLDLVDRADGRIAREPYYPYMSPLRMNRAPAAARELIDADPHAWFASEAGNILSVVRMACQGRRFYLACGIAFRVSSYLYSQSRHQAAEEMWRSVMHVAAEAHADKTAADARHRMASLVARRPGGPARAIPMLDVCVEVFSHPGALDRRSLARSLSLRAWCAHDAACSPDVGAAERTTLLRQAVEDADRGVATAREGLDRHAEMACLRVRGLIASTLGEHEAAANYCRAAVAIGEGIAAETGERSYESWALRGLVTVYLAAGHAEAALELCRRGEEIVAALRNSARAAAVAEQMGDALAALGRHEAAAYYEQAAARFEGDWSASCRERCEGKAAAARAAAASGRR